ncbi:hypothetical protein NWF32_23625 [Pseudomonas qingdaonensis]|nr:hypothetical protein [Pseudomonas qingdaonensis]
MLTLAGLGVLVLLNSAWVLKETLAADKRQPWQPRDILRTYLRIGSDGQFLRPALALAAVFFFCLPTSAVRRSSTRPTSACRCKPSARCSAPPGWQFCSAPSRRAGWWRARACCAWPRPVRGAC